MVKNIGLIAEDISDISVIREIFLKYMNHNDFKVRKFVGNGCGKLRQKCTSWTHMLFKQGCEHVVIVHDLDKNIEAELIQLLNEKVPKGKYPNSLIVIPVKELEAWLLTDSLALQKAFKLEKKPKPRKLVEKIDSPKEYLKKLIWKTGRKRYLNTVHNKSIASYTTLTNLKRCKSFLPLDIYIREQIAG